MPKWKEKVKTHGRTRRRFEQMNPAGREMVHRLMTLLSIEVGKDMSVNGDEMLTSEAVCELQTTVESLSGRRGPQRIRLQSTNLKRALWVKAVCRAVEYTLGVEITATRCFLTQGTYTFQWVRTSAVLRATDVCQHSKTVQTCQICCPVELYCNHKAGRKSSCVECNPCPHGRLKSSCAKCNPCPHGRVKSS
jgi:hypothetical protein